MNNASTIQQHLQIQLIEAIESQAGSSEIATLLEGGAVANDAAVMQAIEEHASQASEDWSRALFAIPQIAEAWRLREVADQAAYDLIDSLEQNDLDGVVAALREMADAGDDANLDMGDGTMLAIAVQNQCDVQIIKVLLDLGKADPRGFSSDAVEALDEIEGGSWKSEIESLFQKASPD